MAHSDNIASMVGQPSIHDNGTATTNSLSRSPKIQSSSTTTTTATITTSIISTPSSTRAFTKSARLCHCFFFSFSLLLSLLLDYLLLQQQAYHTQARRQELYQLQLLAQTDPKAFLQQLTYAPAAGTVMGTALKHLQQRRVQFLPAQEKLIRSRHQSSHWHRRTHPTKRIVSTKRHAAPELLIPSEEQSAAAGMGLDPSTMRASTQTQT